MIFSETLPEATRLLIEKIQGQEFLSSFYLSGGTALALQLGHRESEDLDFFSEEEFEAVNLELVLAKLGNLEDVELSPGTLNTFLMGVKLQFLHYPYPLLEKTVNWKGLSLSSILDIACTKLITISMRGSKKDFIDLYFILKQHSLSQLFMQVRKKYRGTDYNQQHLMKSLVYFEDADSQPMPRMHQQVSWETVKTKIVEEVKKMPI